MKTVLKVLFGVFAFFILVGLLVGDKNASSTTTTAAALDPNGTQGTTAAPVAPATTPERPAPDQPKRTTPRTTPHDSSEHRMTLAKWGTNALPMINAVTRDLQTVGDAATNMDIAGMVQGCRTLKRSVNRLRNALPAPDSELDAALLAAVNDFTEAADHCIRGGTSFDVDEIQEASNYMTAGSGHIRRASARTNELGRGN
jgi:hypothetical protein